MKKISIISALVVTLFASGASAIDLLKKEPGRGELKAGAVVFVDDGTCGKGKVKRLLGGNQSKGVGRTSTCVVNPSAK